MKIQLNGIQCSRKEAMISSFKHKGHRHPVPGQEYTSPGTMMTVTSALSPMATYGSFFESIVIGASDVPPS